MIGARHSRIRLGLAVACALASTAACDPTLGDDAEDVRRNGRGRRDAAITTDGGSARADGGSIDGGSATSGDPDGGGGVAVLDATTTSDATSPVPTDDTVLRFCAGRVSDRTPRPLGPLARPAVGAWVHDPDFGTLITRITDARSGEAITPVYSTVPAWNADGSLLLLYRWGGGHVLYDARTLTPIGELECATAGGSSPGPSDLEHVMWDPTDPDVLFYPSLYAPDERGPLPILYRCNVRTHVATVAHDFQAPPTSCVAGRDELSMGSDPQWFPASQVGLQCGARKWIYDLREDLVHTPRSGGLFVDGVAPIAAPSGTLAYYRGAVFDPELTLLRTLEIENVDEHASIGTSASGHDQYFAVDFDGSDPGVLIAHDLETGARVPLISESLGWGYPPSGVHVSAVVSDPRAAGWALASVVGDTSGEELLAMELVLANVDTREACRIGRHRSHADDYQGEPHPVFHVLPDGTLEVVFASDWGGGDRVDSYLLRVPPR